MKAIGESEQDWLLRMYERHGGFAQTYPLTPEQEEYDNTCRAIDFAVSQLREKRSSLFTVGELGWFLWFDKTLHVFPNQKQLDQHLVDVGALLKSIEERERAT